MGSDEKISEKKFSLQSIQRGTYAPSFFKMRVDTLDKLENPNKLSPEIFSTFFHEYIHFLQDVTTTFGLVNASIIVDRMKDANHAILQTKTATFSVPLPTDEIGISGQTDPTFPEQTDPRFSTAFIPIIFF